MKRDTLIQMARQAGLEFVNQWHPLIEKFEKFALLVAEHEREECLKVCDESCEYLCADAILARGGK